MFDLDIFGLKFENNIIIFDISTLKFFQLQNFVEKRKCLKLGPKMPYWGTFGLECSKAIVIFEISILKFVSLQILIKKKSLNLGPKCLIWVFLTKNTLFGYFGAKILVLRYLMSAPSNLSNCKALQKKQRCLNLGPKMSYLGIFWHEFF